MQLQVLVAVSAAVEISYQLAIFVQKLPPSLRLTTPPVLNSYHYSLVSSSRYARGLILDGGKVNSRYVSESS